MTWLVRWGEVRSGQISSVGSVGNQCCVLLPLNSACYGYVWRATCCASTWKPEQDINNSTTHILMGTARVCLKTFKIYLVGKVISKQPPSLMFTHNLIASSLICRRVDYVSMCNAVRYKHTYTYVPTLVHIQLVLTSLPTIRVNFPVNAITLNPHWLGSCTPYNSITPLTSPYVWYSEGGISLSS